MCIVKRTGGVLDAMETVDAMDGTWCLLGVLSAVGGEPEGWHSSAEQAYRSRASTLKRVWSFLSWATTAATARSRSWVDPTLGNFMAPAV